MTTDFVRTHVAKGRDPIEPYAVDQAPKPGMKPRGLWYEVDGDWRRWCSDEGMDWCNGPLHRVELGDERMLFLRTGVDLDRFHAEFSATETVNGYSEQYGPMDLGIRWADVAERWDGIEIAPYQWSRRLAPHFIWYYGWDCASGVIWRPKGVRLSPSNPSDNR